MGVTDAGFVVKDKEASDVGKFLNRILGLSVERQNLVSIQRSFGGYKRYVQERSFGTTLVF